MIKPHLRRREWFYVDPGTAEHLVGKPGYEWDSARGCPRVHRNMLTLLDDEQARKILARTAHESQGYDTASTLWAARDLWAESLGFKLRVTQQQALDFIGTRAAAMIGDDMRLGKGHPIGTKILTPSGWKPIERLGLTDHVIGANGRSRRVLGVFHRGVLPVYRVMFSDGAGVMVDGDHLWSVWNHNGWTRNRPPIVKETRALVGDLTYGNFGNRKWRIPMVAPIEFVAKDLPIDPYVLGVLLGDGSLSAGGVQFVPGDDDVPIEVAKAIPSTTRLSRRAAQPGKATCWGIVSTTGRVDANPILVALRALGLMGLRSEAKFVPELYLQGSPAQRLALLQGLMDTDGELSVERGFVGFSSASLMLATAVQFLVESLGGSVRMTYKAEPKYKHKGEIRIGLPAHRLTIAMPSGWCPFRARRGYQDRPKFHPARTIAAIEPAGDAEVICLSVDAPDQLYVTERCIVTHNTLSALAAHDPNTGPLMIIAPLSTRAVWLGWARRVFPGTPIGITIGKTFNPDVFEQPIIFGHYDVIHKWRAIRRLGTIVFDEAHLLANADTKRLNAATVLAAFADKRIALTGTPIWNRPDGLWAIISLIAPGAFGSFYDFANRYCGPETTAYGTRWDGHSHEAELSQRMTDTMLRRRWVDVADDLPPITRSVVVADVGEADRRRLDILAAKLKSERTNTAGNLAAYRRQVTGIKLATVIAQAEQIMARGEPVVIWTWHKDNANAIAAALHERAVVIHGDISPDEREGRMQHWRLQPAHALIATLAVAQVGIDLSHARIALFAEIDWIPAIIAQGEMRTYDPTRPMDIIFVIANHLVDQRIVRALVNKLGAQDALGVAAACDSIDALRDAVMGPEESGDLDRMLEDLIASAA